MTTADRMFLRRHYAAFVGVNREEARNAAIRVGFGFGISPKVIADEFGICSRAVGNIVRAYDRKLYCRVLGTFRARRAVEAATAQVDRYRHSLALAERREMAAIDRLRRLGVEVER